MSTTEIEDCEASAVGEAQDAGKAARTAFDRLRRRAQQLADRAQAMGVRAQDLAERAQALRLRAQDAAARAPEQARREISRGRSAAAARLTTLAEAIRPEAEARAARNRRTAAAAGGSTLALALALGAGVALGFYLSRELQKRAASRAADEAPAGEPAAGARPGTLGHDPLATVGGGPH